MARLLLTGTTGYVGGRLLKALEKKNIPVRCLVRRPGVLEGRIESTTELFQADVFEEKSLSGAFANIDVAYYLIHSMGKKGSFRDQDLLAARNFLEAAQKAGVKKIVYLGGLGSGPALSDHLKSRQEVGELFRSSPIPTIEFRAGIIIGSGSLSFEIIRALVQRLPVMTTPTWVRTKTQAIAVEDVIQYLIDASDLAIDRSHVYEIASPNITTYRELMQIYARLRGLKRMIIPVPVLSPKLSSLWLDFVTPVYARIGRHLIDSLRNETIVKDHSAMRDFSIKPRSIEEAIARALSNEDQEFAQTRWSDALSSRGSPSTMNTHRHYQARIIDSRKTVVPVSAEKAFQPIQSIGGKNGWYFANLLWRIRGLIDRIFGGVGLRRGRRDPVDLKLGDALDFWRVVEYQPNKLLRLRAEMKVPGRAWLQFEVEGQGQNSEIRQTAIFDPLGLFGLAYWYALYPLHGLIFQGMLNQVAKRAKN